MRRTPALIVGGGPAGAATALALARAGRPHLLIERSREPGDALCGGFLSWRTLATLAQIGVAADTLNPARVLRSRLFAGARAAEAMLPKPALGVSRRRLDAVLLDHAAAAGARIERGVAARTIAGREVAIAGDIIIADALFLASGKHEVRGSARPAPKADDPTLGLRVRIPPDPVLMKLVGDAVELHLFDRGYAGLVLQEDGSANLCLAVHRSRLNEAGSPESLLRELGDALPQLGERLARMPAGLSVDAVANVPYGWRAGTTVPGVFRLGDQAAVIPSLAGEGMGIALASGLRAAEAYCAQGPAGAVAFQRALFRSTRRPVVAATLVRQLAESPVFAPLLVGGARALPFLTDWVARATRIARAG
ncbi:MAG: FAD-dependent monooxygenase [Pseudomonadota bacterium]